MEEGDEAPAATSNEFEIFKEAIREENLEVQIEITKHLGTLAQHLGEELTRKELLPFIQENIDFHDEILLNLSDQLKQFIPLVGGYDHSQPILELLMKLCNTDETIVRNRTVETLKTIAQNLDKEQTERLFLPVIEKLASDDWFTSKSSAAALHPAIYGKVSEEKQADLRNSFRNLIQDDSPIVRKDATINLIDLIPLIDREHLVNEFIPVFDNLAKDPMDSVRVFAVDVAIALAKRLTEAEVEEFLLKTIENWGDELSWRIRQNLAQNIAEIQRVIPYNKFRGRILAIFQQLLKDVEPEVRIIAARNTFLFCGHLRKTYDGQPKIQENFEPVLLQSILPQINLIAGDPCEEVRLALSSNLLSLSSLVTQEFFKAHLLPLVVKIFENEPSMSIQENMLQNLNMLPSNIDLTQSLVSIRNVVRNLIVNSQSHWRTRRSLLVAFMHIAKFAKKEYFAENLKEFYGDLLGDPIFSVRRTAAVILPLLAGLYGMEWTFEHVLPLFLMFTKDPRYIYRYVPVFGLEELIKPSVAKSVDSKLLRDFKVFVANPSTDDGKRAVRELVEINRSVTKLTEKLNEQMFIDILSLNNRIDDFKNDKISLYAEDTLVILKSTCTGDIFSLNEESLTQNRSTYLKGLLGLIYREYLRIVLELFDDKIVNVQVRSIYILNEIKEFTDRISEELAEPWVNEAIGTLTDGEVKEIEKQVDEELSRRIVHVEEQKEEEEEVIDTDIMEPSESSEVVVPEVEAAKEIEDETDVVKQV